MSRRALVTGGGTGIGAAVVSRLAAEGFEVWAMGRRAERVEQGAGRAVVGDVRVPDDRRRALEATGDLDLLVNNAGMGVGSWDDIIDVNLNAAHRLSRGGAAGARAALGHVVMIASIAGHRGPRRAARLQRLQGGDGDARPLAGGRRSRPAASA